MFQEMLLSTASKGNSTTVSKSDMKQVKQNPTQTPGSTKFKNKINFKIILVFWVANGRSSRSGPYLQTDILQWLILLVVHTTAESFTAAASAAGQLVPTVCVNSRNMTSSSLSLWGCLYVCLSFQRKVCLNCIQQLLPVIQTLKLSSVFGFPQLAHSYFLLLWISHQRLAGQSYLE